MKNLVKITDFGMRHFDPKFGGTKILDETPEEVERIINLYLHNSGVCSFDKDGENYDRSFKVRKSEFRYWNKIISGYAPFCKLLFMKNFTDARIGSMPITLENYQYLRSGYSARRDTELPVLSRWFELPVPKPKADYLMFVLYSKTQIDKEAKKQYEEDVAYIKKHGINPRAPMEEPKPPKPFETDWGIVSINGQTHPNEEPMTPVTMMRNALGMEEGGSGVAIKRKKYEESVEFWKTHAIVK